MCSRLCHCVAVSLSDLFSHRHLLPGALPGDAKIAQMQGEDFVDDVVCSPPCARFTGVLLSPVCNIQVFEGLRKCASGVPRADCKSSMRCYQLLNRQELRGDESVAS